MLRSTKQVSNSSIHCNISLHLYVNNIIIRTCAVKNSATKSAIKLLPKMKIYTPVNMESVEAVMLKTVEICEPPDQELAAAVMHSAYCR